MSMKIEKIENGYLVEDFDSHKTTFFQKPEAVLETVKKWLEKNT